MTVAEIIAELDDHGFSDTSPTRKVEEINNAQWETCARHPWPFLKTQATVATTSATGAVTMPTDYATPLVMYSDKGEPLRPIRAEEYMRRFARAPASTGNARYFFRRGSQLFVHPRPAANPNMTLLYLRTPAELAVGSAESAIEIPPRWHRILVAGSLFRLYIMEDDPELAAAFKAEYDELVNDMAAELVVVQNESPLERPVATPEGGEQ